MPVRESVLKTPNPCWTHFGPQQGLILEPGRLCSPELLSCSTPVGRGRRCVGATCGGQAGPGAAVLRCHSGPVSGELHHEGSVTKGDH